MCASHFVIFFQKGTIMRIFKKNCFQDNHNLSFCVFKIAKTTAYQQHSAVSKPSNDFLKANALVEHAYQCKHID